MEYRRLGRTGLRVSVLGVGGHTYPVGDGPDAFCTPADRAALVGRLLHSGVNYFDTTWLNEVELLADSLRRLDGTAGLHISLQYVDGVSDRGWRGKLRGELERRLAVLGWDRAPLFLMGVGNGCPPRSEIQAACEALHALKEEGLVEHLGLSCHEPACFADLAATIEESDLPDYLMIRFNWKFRQAAERLFPVAAAHDVGIVVMKVFCWDCGPDNWGRRISVFEPAADVAPVQRNELNPAQRALLWCLQQSLAATSVPSINAAWEADELLAAVQSEHLASAPEVDDLPTYVDRLYEPSRLQALAVGAESRVVRQRALALL